jgi:hypothetical protein
VLICSMRALDRLVECAWFRGSEVFAAGTGDAPFHPWAGRDLEFVKRRNNWRADRVYVRGDAGELVSLPAEWTDVVPEDAVVVVAGGRVPFHLGGLLALSELVASLAAAR